MKLRKALDQAKMERQNGGSVSRVSNTVITKNSSSQWVSPGYDAPCASPLDRKVAEKNRGVCLNPNNKEVEQYRILKTRIAQVAKTNKMNSIMITSPNKGEGKTVTCINIGFTFARAMDQTALLVDCDFKGQDIHRYLGIANKESLIDYFLDNVPLKELIVWPGVDKLTLISGDRTVNESTELLSSDMMADLVNEMSSRYDDRMVFFDSPPVLEQSESISMAPLMDGILMVVEYGKTTKKDIARSLDLLPKEKFLGFVLNKQGA